MTAAQFEVLAPSEAEELLRARFETFAEWGCPLDDALMLAGRVEIEVADAISLLQRGCPPKLVPRLLG
ncbi:MAG: hypothetical protein OEW31_06505 [Thermoleophilia bacterium]|nr:hypothetical protein [Thermoleophilia bacterium]MDH5332241.1 hypothetical protein [Thermoleophilia bacterium]